MDSKVRLRTIAVVLIAFLAVLPVVAFANADMLRRRLFPEEEKQETEAGQETSGLGLETPFGIQVGDKLSAFESDPLFFDQSVGNGITLPNVPDHENLSLVLTSIEKDIRVQIVDILGKPVEGHAFFVTLLREGDAEPVGQYKDLDRDGVIYAADLLPGIYHAFLSPMEDYIVPKDPAVIRVKAKVEYTPIADIALLIRSEDEIEAAAEDTEMKEPEQEQASEPSSAAFPGGRGIDVSKYQKDIDWERVSASGINFAILRCGYRGSKTGCLVEDPFFEANLHGAREAGLRLGLYFFTQAVNEVEAVEEASMVLALLGGEALDYPIYIDTEGAGGNGRADTLDPKDRTAVCSAFCRTIEAAGYRAGIYASRNWWQHNLIRDELEDYETWLAEYTDEPKYDGSFSLWQYTSKGRVDGIIGNVDMNLALEHLNEEDEPGAEDEPSVTDEPGEQDEPSEEDEPVEQDESGAEDEETPI